jgi:hypothetical protein
VRKTGLIAKRLPNLTIGRKLTGVSDFAVNTRDYLCKEKGIDPARIQPRSIRRAGKKVDLWIAAAGAEAPAASRAVDESRVKAVPRVPLKPKAHGKPAQPGAQEQKK